MAKNKYGGINDMPSGWAKTGSRWDKTVSFMSAHACAFWSSGKKTRYRKNYDFCSFVKRKGEHYDAD